MDQPAVSIVVIGQNEGSRLRECLESIRSIRGVQGAIETIYVDSCSTDGSPEVAAECGAEVFVLETNRPTASLGRNAGWARARAKYILFLDGDTVVDPDFLAKALASISADAKIAAVWGHLREIHPHASIYNRVIDLDWVFETGTSDFCGGIALMRRQALEDVGGFDSSLAAGEEPELCRRMRALDYSILHIDEPMVGHDLQMKHFRQYWKRALRAGHAYAEVSARFRGTADPFWQAERKSNLRRGGFWLVSFFLAVAATILFRSFLPALAWIGLLLLLSLRTAWNARWKSRNVVTLLLYGVHSQLQQIPIFLGQLQFDHDRRRRRQRKLIEYKGSSCQT
jgi:GT2 family glycosyltransferase